MTGRRSAIRAIAAGKVSRATSRTPSPARSTNPARLRSATRRASSGTKVVVIDIASNPWGSWNTVKALT